jgi:iron(III) transport system substrate-binding protein
VLNSTRRGFVRVGGAAGIVAAAVACAPAAAPAPAASGQPAAGSTSGAAWEGPWRELIAAAKKEGKLVIVTGVGETYKRAAGTFQEAFPEIVIESTQLNASAFAPRALQERKAGIYTYDILMSTYGTAPLTMIPEGALEPVRPLMIRTDAMQDSVWSDGGFDAGWRDKDKKFGYAAFNQKSRWFWVNTDVVKDGEIKTVQDLLNPKWKGKILGGDPRVYGGGWYPATIMRLGLGDDVLRRLYKDQEVVLSRDTRQLTELMVRGSYPIGLGAPNEAVLQEFMDKGLAKNLKHIELDHCENLYASSNVVMVFNRAPNPNAAKLFVNWILTKEGSTAWSKEAITNSRRKDVQPFAPDNVPTPGKKYIQMDDESYLDAGAKTIEMAKQLLT